MRGRETGSSIQILTFDGLFTNIGKELIRHGTWYITGRNCVNSDALRIASPSQVVGKLKSQLVNGRLACVVGVGGKDLRAETLGQG